MRTAAAEGQSEQNNLRSVGTVAGQAELTRKDQIEQQGGVSLVMACVVMTGIDVVYVHSYGLYSHGLYGRGLCGPHGLNSSGQGSYMPA